MPFIQFQFRRGTSTEWSNSNPTLASGEIGIETNTNLFKIGNGTATWNILPYGGIQGLQGLQGLQGIQGIQGTSIQGIQGGGFNQNQGVQGIQGTGGANGANGAQGIQGTTGSGTQGITGTNGTQGFQGIQGTYGSDGIVVSSTPPANQGVLWLDTTASSTTSIQGIQGTTGATGNFSNPFPDALTISNTTASTSKTTGSLILAGGLGVAGSIYSTASYDDKGEVRLLPINTQTSSYALVAADHGKCVSTTSGITVPASIFSAGQIISVFNNSASAITLTTSAVTAYKAGTDTAVTSLSLAARGIATVLFITATVVVISGNVT